MKLIRFVRMKTRNSRITGLVLISLLFAGIVQAQPILNVNPSSRTVRLGDTTFFYATSTGMPLSYMWYHNGYPVGYSDTLWIYNAGAANAGPYYCIIFDQIYGYDTTSPGILNLLNLSSGIVGDYPFNGNANDLSGNGYNGIVTAATLDYDRFGNPNSAYYFNGSSAQILLNSFPINQTQTISMWVNPDSVSTNVALLASDGSFSFGMNSSYYISGATKAGSTCGSAWTTNVQATSPVLNNSWSHIVWMRNSNGNERIYINGTLVASQTTSSSSIPVCGYGTYLGAIKDYMSNFSSYFHGFIDDVKVYNRELSVMEVQSLYNAGLEPVITQHPHDQHRAIGDMAVFKVVASGSDLVYQWQKNGSELWGETADSLVIWSVSAYDTGWYRCIVSNTYGSDTSNYARLNFLTIDSGLAAYYPFFGNAADSSGNGNHGTVYNAALTTDRFGNLNAAYAFDGNGDYIYIPYSSSLDIKEDITLSAWVKFNTLTGTNGTWGNQIIWHGELTPYTDQYYLFLNGDSIQFGRDNIAYSPGDRISVTTYLLDTINYHLITSTYSKNKGMMRLYLDGYLITNKLVDTSSYNYSTSGLWTVIGAANFGDYSFNGSIDDVRIYNRVLNDNEIITLYYEPNPITFVEVPNANLTGASYASSDWGDFDNDGDLDLVISGYHNSNYMSKLYRNDGGGAFTEMAGAGLTGIANGSVKWGDSDGDGDLDLLLSGRYGSGMDCTKLYRNDGAGNFTELSALNLPGLYRPSVAWGDYDNDGDLDFVLSGDSSGVKKTSIFRNEGDNYFKEMSGISLQGVYWGSAAWGDYDNDGDLDLLLSGSDGSIPYTILYNNDGQGGFAVDSNAIFEQVYASSLAWGDYDNNGYLDILLTGASSGGAKTKIYRNYGYGNFTELSGINIAQIKDGSAVWGDYDNNGYLDILLSGDNNSTIYSEIYRNNGSGNFEKLNNAYLKDLKFSSANWVDFDNDGRLDVLISGYDGDSLEYALIYKNQVEGEPNSPPSAPYNNYSVVYGDEVKLYWNPSYDFETYSTGLSYNVYVYEQASAKYINPHEADLESGWRRIASIGNVQYSDSGLVLKNLKPGCNYIWSVQAVDAGLRGGAFADFNSFSGPGLDYGLVVFYPFSGNTGDSSGFMNDATAYGATLANDRKNDTLSAYHFDGVDDYMNTPHDSSIDFSGSNDFAVQLWFKADTLTNSTIFDKIPETSNINELGIYLHLTSTGIINFQLAKEGVGWDTCHTIQSIAANTWNHVVGVKSGNTVSIYLNGILEMTAPLYYSLSALKDTAAITLGKIRRSNSNHFIGSIDEVRVYNRSVTENEVTALFNFGLSALNGIYTISHGGGDFNSFTDAVNALKYRGVYGPVTFEVDSGTYNEQIVIPQIQNSSSGILFKSTQADSTKVILTYSSTSPSKNYTIRFENASNITFSNMTIQNTGSIYARVIDFTANSYAITLSGNIIRSYGDFATGIDIQCISSGGNSSSYLTFEGNKIIGGRGGIVLQSTTGISEIYVNQNIFQDFIGSAIKIKGYYNIYIEQNHIQTSTAAYYCEGVSMEYSNDFIIKNNTILIQNNYNAEAIHLWTCQGSEGGLIIANNSISMISGSGKIGMALSGTSTIKIAYNTVNIASNSPLGRVLYMSGGASLEIGNNIFSNQGGGSVLFYHNWLSQYVMLYKNNYYSSPQGSPLVIFEFNTTLYSLKQYKDFLNNNYEFEIYDDNSLSIEPLFNSETDLHTSQIAFNGIADYDYAVDYDLDGNIRDESAPDIGAYEFTPGPLSGNYTLGTDGTKHFRSFYHAVNSLIEAGINGPVSILVDSGFYQEQVLIPAISGSSDTNVIIFQGASADSTYAQLQYNSVDDIDNYTLKLDGASNIVIKGLTVLADDPYFGNAIVITGNATKNEIRNCFVRSAYNPYNMSCVGILCEFSSNNKIINNYVYGGVFGIRVEGSGDPLDFNNRVIGNVVEGYNIQYGIYAYYQEQLIIEKNKVSDIGNDYDCIRVSYSNGTKINNNNISSGSRGVFLTYENSSYSDTSEIINNYVYGQIALSGDLKCIHLYDVNNLRLYHNTVRLNDYSLSTGSGALVLDGVENAEIKNNIIVAENDCYILWEQGCNNIDLDYNDYFFPNAFGANKFYLTGGNNYTSLDSFRLASNSGILSGHDLNSYDVDPEFVSYDAPNITSPILNNAGTALNVASDIFGNVRNMTNPDIGAVEFEPPLYDTLVIDSSGNGDYLSFTEAVNDLHARGIGSDVVFVVAPGTYNEQITIGEYFNSGVYSVTFESQNGDSSSVDLSWSAGSENDNYTVRFENADYVSFQKMTISAKGANYATAVEYRMSTYQINISNCRLIGKNVVSGSQDFAVVKTDTNIHNSISIYYSEIKYGSSGIYLLCDGHELNIFGNRITDFYKNGIYMKGVKDFYIQGNYISTVSSSPSKHGIFSDYCSEEFFDPYITENKIYLLAPNTAQCYGIGINLYNPFNPQQSTLIISNNFVSVSGSDSSCAIYTYNSKDVRIVNNSLNLTNNPSWTATLWIGGEQGEYIQVFNNVIANNAGGLAVAVPDTMNILEMNYNDYYSTGTTLFDWNNIPISSLDSFRNRTGFDQNSINCDPNYFSVSDLHTNALCLKGAGNQEYNVWVDIDQDPRGWDVVDIGADEFDLPKMKGTYLISQTDTTADFISFTEAVQMLNLMGIDSNIEFLVDDGIYNEQVLIGNFEGSEQGYTVTFRSLNNDSSSVILTYSSTDSMANYTLGINQAKDIYFRNMTIISSAPYYNTAIRIIGWGYNYGFENCIIQSPVVNENNLIHSVFVCENEISYLHINNCKILNGSIGIYMSGNPFYVITQALIENNQISGFYHTGIASIFARGTFRNNYFENSPGSTKVAGFLSVFEPYEEASMIYRNKFVLHGADSIYGFFYEGQKNPYDNIDVIANNFISIEAADYISYGFYSEDIQKIQYVFNSVHLFNSSGNSSAIKIISGSDVELVNNIFSNVNGGYAIEIDDTFAIFNLSNNNYFSTGTYFGKWGGNDFNSLSAWNAATNLDSNSLNVNPGFVSDTNLHIISSQMNGAGIPFLTMGNITDYDIDGELRDLNYPDIGADEFAGIRLKGTYLISQTDTSADYTSFTAAVNDLMTYGIDSMVVFEVDAGIYNEQLTFRNYYRPELPDARVIFTSKTNDTSSVVLTYAPTQSDSNWTICFQNAGFVTFQYMTIRSMGNTYGRVIVFNNTINTGGYNFNHNLFYTKTPNTDNDAFSIFYSRTQQNGSEISNNVLIGGAYGIFFEPGYFNSCGGWIGIYSNQVKEFYTAGILVHNLSWDSYIGSNIIQNSSTSVNCTGMDISNPRGTDANRIYLRGSGILKGIVLRQNGITNDYLSNSFISIYTTTGTPYGIYFDSTSNVFIKWNSINIWGTSSGSAIKGNTSMENVYIYNNIFCHKSGGLAVDLVNTSGIYNLNYNNYFSNGTYLGKWEGTPVSNFSQWQSITGWDSNSLSVYPQFFSNTDLHIQKTIELDGAGIPLFVYTPYDIDGNCRDTLHPDIGADEFYNLDIGNDTAFCEGSVIYLDAGTEAPYLWNDNSTDRYLAVNTSGTYFVKIGGAGWCQTTQYDTINVTVWSKPVITLGNDTAFCSGGMATYDAGAGFTTYLWNNDSNETSRFFSTQIPGPVFVQVSDSNGCTDTDTAIVTIFQMPQFMETNITNKTSNSATFSANISSKGTGDIINRGFCIKTYGLGEPTLSDTVINESGIFGTGNYSLSITGLLPEHKYVVRPFAQSNCLDYGYTEGFWTLSDEPIFHASTFTATTVSTTEIVLNFNAASAIPNCDGYIILQNSDSSVITVLPQDAHAYSVNSMIGSSIVAALIYNTSATQAVIQNLTPSSTYHFFIIPFNWDNGASTEVFTYNYKTSPSIPSLTASTIMPPVVNTLSTQSGVTHSQITLSAEITDTRGANVSTRGILFNTYTTADITLADYQNGESGSYTTGIYNRTILGLNPETRYKYRAYAVNSAGVGLGSHGDFYTLSAEPAAYPLSFIANPVSSNQIMLTFSKASTISNCDGYLILHKQGTSPTETPADGHAYQQGIFIGTAKVAAIISDTGQTSVQISNLIIGKSHNFTIYPFNWDLSNAPTINYYTSGGAPVASAITAVAPTVLSGNLSGITNNQVTMSGFIADTGGIAVSNRGFCYKVYASGDPTIANMVTQEVGSYSTGSYSINVGILAPQTRYKIRSFASNATGTGYGNVLDFYTLSSEPAGTSSAFYSTVLSKNSVKLYFTEASMITNCAGYLILGSKVGTITSSPSDGQLYLTGNSIDSYFIAAIVTNTSATNIVLNDLSPATSYEFKIFPFNWDGTNYQTYNFRTVSPLDAYAYTAVNPVLATSPNVSNITSDSVLVSGEITDDGGSTIDKRGFVFKVYATGDPTISNSFSLENGSFGEGVFSRTLTGLIPGTRYKFRSYVYSEETHVYGPVSYDFYTLSSMPSSYPALFSATSAAAGQVKLSFSSASSISNASGYLILQKQGSAPTGLPLNAKAYAIGNPVGDAVVAAIVNNDTVTQALITGLNSGQYYYFSIIPYNWNNSAVETYHYRTVPTIPVVNALSAIAPTLLTNSAENISVNSVKINCEIVADGGINATNRGVCYKVFSAGDPTISDSTNFESGSYSYGEYSRSITNLLAKTHYKARAYAINPAGLSYGQSIDFYTLAQSPLTHASSFIVSSFSASQIDLSFSAANSIANANGYIILQKQGSAPVSVPQDGVSYVISTSIGDALVAAIITNPIATSVSITSVTPGNLYYFTLIPFSWDGLNSETYNYYTSPVIPQVSAIAVSLPQVVTTGIVQNISSVSANVEGTIVSSGGSICASRGICYKVFTAGDPDTNNMKSVQYGSFLTGNYTSSLSSLLPQTRYKARAYTTNPAGLAYGSSIDFFTLASEPQNHAALFTASTSSTTQLDLSFSAPSSIPNANSYLILQKQGSVPTGIPDDAHFYLVGTPIGDAVVSAVITNSSGTAAFISSVNPGNEYYFKLIPFNWDGVNVQTINYLTSGAIPVASAKTIVPPTVLTQSTPLSSGDATITLGLEILNTGEANCHIKGICYKEYSSGDPTINDMFKADTGSFAKGNYSVFVDGLTTATRYKFRAFAINSAGISYGSSIDFYSPSIEPFDHAAFLNASASSLAQVDLSFPEASNILNCSGYLILQRKDTLPVDLPEDGKAYLPGFSIGDGMVAAIVTEINDTGVSITSVMAGNTYYFMLIPFNWDGSNSQTINYRLKPIIPSAYTMMIAPPTLTTSLNVRNITPYSADIDASIISSGGAQVTQTGVCYRVFDDIEPDINDFKSGETGVFGLGPFTRTLPYLTPETRYIARSYASNMAGYGYGNSVDFYSLSREPASHSSAFSSIVYSTTQVDLYFSPAKSIVDADGYLIFMAQSTIPDALPENGRNYTVGNIIGNSILVAKVLNADRTTISITDLNPSTEYYFSLVPFNWDGSNALTYNYRTRSMIPVTRAVTTKACPIKSGVVAQGSTIICHGDSLLLQADTGYLYRYQWTIDGTVSLEDTLSYIFAKQSGKYRVFIRNDYCAVASIPVEVAFYPSVPPVIAATGKLTPCINDSMLLFTDGYSDYLWNTGQQTQSIYVHKSGDYYITVVDEYGCKVTSGLYSVNASAAEPPEICIVTVDTNTSKNLIAWEREQTSAIEYYIIYKETTQAGVYQQIGTVPYDSLSVFVDAGSNPAKKSARYRISFIDTCHFESSLSKPHKTMHLSANQGVGGTVNLVWTHYEGFPFNSYKIYRGTSPNSLLLIDSIQSNLNSYTDLNPPKGLMFYQVLVVSPKICAPAIIRGVTTSGPFSQSLSNLKDYTMTPNPYLAVTPSIQRVTLDSGQSAVFSVFTNLTLWDASTTADWVSLTKDLLNGEITTTVTSKNTADDERVAVITITGVGISDRTIFLIQNGRLTGVPDQLSLLSLQVYPNPFTSHSNIIYELARECNVKLEIMNSLGQKVAVLADEKQTPGVYTYLFDPGKFTSDFYFVTIRLNNEVLIRKIVRIQ